jgi:hypothetical protein
VQCQHSEGRTKTKLFKEKSTISQRKIKLNKCRILLKKSELFVNIPRGGRCGIEN